jgi:L-ascorbate metabolism protein UlaG (beta-lactamase superfamily)
MPVTTVTRVTHACVLLDFDGFTVLTDPWFSERRGYRRGEPLAFDVPALPRLGAVVVSHGHYDHFDLAAFAAYPDRRVPFVVQRGLAAQVLAAGFTQVTELDPWQSAQIGPVTITAAPAEHGVPEVTFILGGAASTVFFGADTRHIPELAEIAHRFPDIDLALLPVNGLAIRPALNKQVVMTAMEAAALTATLRPRIAVPIHYAFTGGPVFDRLILKLDRDPRHYRDAAADLAPDTTVRILAPGESLAL